MCKAIAMSLNFVFRTVQLVELFREEAGYKSSHKEFPSYFSRDLLKQTPAAIL